MCTKLIQRDDCITFRTYRSWFFDSRLIVYNNFLKEIFLSRGHDRVVKIKFFIAKVLCCPGLYWSTRGCNLVLHSSIHASFILRRGLTRFQLPMGFLSLRIVELRNSSDILETDRKHHTHCFQSFVSPDWIPPGTLYHSYKVTYWITY